MKLKKKTSPKLPIPRPSSISQGPSENLWSKSQSRGPKHFFQRIRRKFFEHFRHFFHFRSNLKNKKIWNFFKNKKVFSQNLNLKFFSPFNFKKIPGTSLYFAEFAIFKISTTFVNFVIFWFTIDKKLNFSLHSGKNFVLIEKN